MERKDCKIMESPPKNSDLKIRTKLFAISIIRFVRSLPKTEEAFIFGKQLLRSGTSVGANYRAARRGKSTADFINKIIIVEEEADECCYWLELLAESNIVDKKQIESLLKEANELTAIFTATGKTAKANRLNQ